jgi:hypothetical protein
MTHDELLAKINEISPADKYDASWQSALRAVVELHRPIWRGCNEDNCCGSTDICGLCADEYPCDTIQAIEKELE